MNTLQKLKIIKFAQKRLVNNPQDPYHDVTHHYRVLLLAKQIVAAEKLEVDRDLVEIICWWHDVQIKPATEDTRVVVFTAEYLRDLMPDETKQIAYDSVLNHEFGSTPNFLEGKVLQDADKLEILSPERIDIAVDAVNAGFIEKDKALKTLDDIKTEWLPKMLDRYHFEFSKKFHREHQEEFIEYLEGAKLSLS